MKLEEKRILDLSYSFLGIFWYWLQKLLILLKVQIKHRNKPEHFTSKYDISKGLKYKRSITYFDVDLSSSGTTGSPTTVYASPMHWISEQSAQMQFFKENGYNFRDKMILVRSYSPKENQPFFKFDRLRNFIYISPFHLSIDNKEKILSFFKGKYFLRGYPSSLEILSKLITKSDNFDKPHAVFTASETLNSYQRKLIETKFDSKLYDWYGTSEPAVLLFQTKNSFPFYKTPMNHCSYKIIKDDKNNSILYGRSNWDTLSNLGYFKTDDVVVLDHLNNIISIKGRKSDIIEYKNKFIPLTNFLTLFYSIKKIKKFQILNNIYGLEFIIILEDKCNNKLSIKINNEIKKRVLEIPFKINYNKKLIQSSNGKTPYFIKIKK